MKDLHTFLESELIYNMSGICEKRIKIQDVTALDGDIFIESIEGEEVQKFKTNLEELKDIVKIASGFEKLKNEVKSEGL